MLRALALVVLLLVPTASAITIDLEAREDAQGSYFALAGDDARNPTLTAPPGDSLVVRFTNAGAVRHGLRFGDPLNAALPCCQAPNETRTLTLEIPANLSGDVPYQDPLHPSATGTLRIGAPLPVVRILAPQNGANVPRRVTMSVEVLHFALGTDGRIRWEWSAGNQTLNATDAQTSHVFDGLGNGPHLLRAILVDAKGAPLDPPAGDDVVVYVAPTATDDTVGAPPVTSAPEPSATPSKSPDVGLPIALAALALVALRRRR